MYPFMGAGNEGVLWHAIGRELRHHYEPFVCEALQVTQHNLRRGLGLFRHGLRWKEKQHSLNPGNPPFFFFFILSLILFRCKEGGGKVMMDYARGCGGVQGQPPAFITP
jgi:hypothetical protein